jgi:hypothetical protein
MALLTRTRRPSRCNKLLGSYVIKCSDIGLEPEKKRAPGNIPADSATPYTLRWADLEACRRVAGKFAPFVIGDAHIISKTGQAAYGELIIVACAAAELAQTPYYKTMSEIIPNRQQPDPNQYQQGDVWIERVGAIPDGAELVDGVTLAEGEGHYAHRFAADADVEIYVKGGVRIISAVFNAIIYFPAFNKITFEAEWAEPGTVGIMTAPALSLAFIGGMPTLGAAA